jgi:hypothetical protein
LGDQQQQNGAAGKRDGIFGCHEVSWFGRISAADGAHFAYRRAKRFGGKGKATMKKFVILIAFAVAFSPVAMAQPFGLGQPQSALQPATPTVTTMPVAGVSLIVPAAPVAATPVAVAPAAAAPAVIAAQPASR